MSGAGEPTLDLGNVSDLRVAIVSSQWHETICTALLDGALRAAADAGTPTPTVVRVAGAIELPVIVQALAQLRDAGFVVQIGHSDGTYELDLACFAHMSDAELARDLHAALAKVQQGVEIIIEQDHRPIAVLKASASVRPGRKLSECIAIAEAYEKKLGYAALCKALAAGGDGEPAGALALVRRRLAHRAALALTER